MSAEYVVFRRDEWEDWAWGLYNGPPPGQVIVLHMRGPWRSLWWLLAGWPMRRRARRAYLDSMAPDVVALRVVELRRAVESSR